MNPKALQVLLAEVVELVESDECRVPGAIHRARLSALLTVLKIHAVEIDDEELDWLAERGLDTNGHRPDGREGGE